MKKILVLMIVAMFSVAAFAEGQDLVNNAGAACDLGRDVEEAGNDNGDIKLDDDGNEVIIGG